MFSIKTRLIALYTFFFGILLIYVAFSALNIVERMYIAKLDSYLMAYADAIEETLHTRGIQEVINSKDKNLVPVKKQKQLLETFRIFQQWTMSPIQVKIRLTDSSGRVIIDDSILSGKERAPGKKYGLHWGPGTRSVTIGKMEYRISTKRLTSADHPGLTFQLELAASLNDLEMIRNEVNQKHFHIIGIALFITGIIAYFITRFSFKPVTQMAGTASIISAGTLDKRLELPRAKDEIRMLGETLNAMIDRIADSFKTQQQFIADASHEIRTPLTIIQAELELALKQIKDPETREGIETSLLELEHLNKLTASLLTLARLDASENASNFQPVRIDELLAECIQGLQNVAQNKKISLDLTINDASDIYEIPGDREKLKNMLLNIIENAIKYSPAHRHVIVELTDHSLTHVCVTVKDSGAGISPQALPNIFNRFYRAPQTRNKVAGSGLGLAIAKKIALLHKAEINFDSTEGQGTTVTILIPTSS